MPGPNANGFASQWNIGFTILMYDLCIFLDNLLSRYLTSKGSRHHIIKSSRYFITLPFSIHKMANHESLKYVIRQSISIYGNTTFMIIHNHTFFFFLYIDG